MPNNRNHYCYRCCRRFRVFFVQPLICVPLYLYITWKSTTLPTLSLSPTHISSYYPQIQAGAQVILGTGTGTGAAANYTGAAAYNPTTLNSPSPPGAHALPTQFAIQPPNAVPPGASILQNGSFRFLHWDVGGCQPSRLVVHRFCHRKTSNLLE